MTLDQMTFRETFTLLTKVFFAAIPALFLVGLAVGAVVFFGMMLFMLVFGTPL